MVVFGSGKSQRKLLFVGGGKMKNKTSSPKVKVSATKKASPKMNAMKMMKMKGATKMSVMKMMKKKSSSKVSAMKKAPPKMSAMMKKKKRSR